MSNTDHGGIRAIKKFNDMRHEALVNRLLNTPHKYGLKIIRFVGYQNFRKGQKLSTFEVLCPHCNKHFIASCHHLHTRRSCGCNRFFRNSRKEIRGGNAPMAKLSNEDASLIKQFHKNGYSYYKLSQMFNVSYSSIWNIIQGQSYKDAK